MKTQNRFLALFVTTACLLAGGAAAFGQAARPIISLPATITKPGRYLVKKNLQMTKTADAAITIAADDVVLDLGGNVITNGLPAGSEVTGINSVVHGGITVMNGTVRGFTEGISLNALQAAVGSVAVEGVRVEKCGLTGISVKGLTIAVRRCTISDTGNATIYSPTGIFVDGEFANLIDNEVLMTIGSPGSSSTGIHCGTQACVMENNRVMNGPTNRGTIGIYAGLQTNYLVENNRVAGFTNGIKFSHTGAPKYRNNFTTDCTVPYTNGTDAGNNK